VSPVESLSVSLSTPLDTDIDTDLENGGILYGPCDCSLGRSLRLWIRGGDFDFDSDFDFEGTYSQQSDRLRSLHPIFFLKKSTISVDTCEKRL
jgi:hypothetical protein